MQQMIFIADIIACSTCFGRHYAHHQELESIITSGCCLSYLVLWFSSCRCGVELRVVCPVCGLLGIMAPETCRASNNICNKNHLLHLVGILFPHINDDARSKPHQMLYQSLS